MRHLLIYIVFCVALLPRPCHAWDETTDEAPPEGRAEGRAEGEAIGLEKGVKKEKIENARRMKECGVDSAIISTVTGLTISEIEAL